MINKTATKAKTATAKSTPSKSGTLAPVSPLDGSTPAPAATAAPSVVDSPQSVILGPVMRKKELINTVVERSGIKKKDAKPVVEAMLAVLGEALADNRELILPPFGKAKVRREKALPNGRVMVVKVRQTVPPISAPSDEMPDAAE